MVGWELDCGMTWLGASIRPFRIRFVRYDFDAMKELAFSGEWYDNARFLGI